MWPYSFVLLILLVLHFYYCAMTSASRYGLYDIFSQVETERTNEMCERVSGRLPDWLNGFFLRQTSGSWGKLNDPVPTRIENLQDAIGMGSVYRITGKSNNIVYSNRYYRSMAYQVWRSNGQSLNQAGAAFWTYFSKTSSQIEQSVNRFPGFLAYSPSHTFWKLGTQIEAVSDGTFGTKVDIATMENDGKPFPFSDSGASFGLDGLMFNNAAHAAEDPASNTIWSAVYNANPSTGKTRLIIYQIQVADLIVKRQIYAVKELPQFSTVDCDTNPATPVEQLKQYRDPEPLPGYIHDIAATPNYVVLPVSSMLVDYCFMFAYKYWPIYLYAPLYSFWFKWRPDKYSAIQLLNKSTKRFYEVRIQPLFIAHIVNAFEDQVTGTIVLDVLTSNDGSYLADCWSLSRIVNNNGFTCPSRIERIIIDIPDLAASRYRLTQVEWNFYAKPRINPKYAGRYYTQAYMVNKWLSPGQNSVVKLNTRTTEITQWVPDDNYLVDEVVFAPNPSNRFEEDGVLLVSGQNLNTNRGFLVILEPSTMTKLAEIGAPDSTPPSGGYSQFYSFQDLGLAQALLGSANNFRANSIQTLLIVCALFVFFYTNNLLLLIIT